MWEPRLEIFREPSDTLLFEALEAKKALQVGSVQYEAIHSTEPRLDGQKVAQDAVLALTRVTVSLHGIRVS